MQSLDYYQEKLQAIKAAVDEHLAAIMEDGTVDYEEAIETKSLTDDFSKQLRALRKELNLDIREIRADHDLRINNAERGDKGHLRRDKRNALAPYEQIKLLIDRLLLDLSSVKDSSVETLEEFESLAQAETEPAEHDDEDEGETVSLEEVRALAARWRSLLASVEEPLRAGHHSAKHHIRLRTAEHVLHIVLEDIGHLIEA